MANRGGGAKSIIPYLEEREGQRIEDILWGPESTQEIAVRLGVSKSTIYRWRGLYERKVERWL